MNLTKYISAAEAVKNISSGNRVFMHGGAATSVHLVKALQQRHAELEMSYYEQFVSMVSTRHQE